MFDKIYRFAMIYAERTPIMYKLSQYVANILTKYGLAVGEDDTIDADKMFTLLHNFKYNTEIGGRLLEGDKKLIEEFAVVIDFCAGVVYHGGWQRHTDFGKRIAYNGVCEFGLPLVRALEAGMRYQQGKNDDLLRLLERITNPTNSLF